MTQNFLSCDREQDFLMPPSVREWLPAGHLAWWLLDVLEQLDLTAFYAEYRADGSGRAAHDPQMMVGLLLYAYAVGERSSREIERRCAQDVAFRVMAANRAPDHTTINRFRKRHADRLAGLFVQVLAICARAGMVRVGLVAVDGNKLAANAGLSANRTTARSVGRSSRSWPRLMRSTLRRTRCLAPRVATSRHREQMTRPRAVSAWRRPSARSRQNTPSFWRSMRRRSRVVSATASRLDATRWGARPVRVPARCRRLMFSATSLIATAG